MTLFGTSVGLISIILLSTPGQAAGDIIAGKAEAKDADTLRINDQLVDLWGIDALEIAQQCSRRGECFPCGLEAARALNEIIDGRTVSCERVATDSDGRVVAKCRYGTLDVAAEMVNLGWAVHRNDDFYYRFGQREARNREAGMWGSIYVRPDRWKDGERLPSCTGKD